MLRISIELEPTESKDGKIMRIQLKNENATGRILLQDFIPNLRFPNAVETGISGLDDADSEVNGWKLEYEPCFKLIWPFRKVGFGTGLTFFLGARRKR